MAINNYRTVIKRLIADYAEIESPKNGVHPLVILDDERGHYQLMRIGWEGDKRVYHIVLHIDLIEDKVWIQRNATDQQIAEELVDLGIPRNAIVLGIHPPRVRQFTDFAVA